MMSSIRPSGGRIDSSNLTKPQRKRGRPPIEDETLTIADMEVQQRKAKTRLAQRAYRSRRDEKFEMLSIKNSRLEHALDEIISSFTSFHSLAMENHDLPPYIASALARTSMSIAAIVLEARSGRHSSQSVTRDFSGNASQPEIPQTQTPVAGVQHTLQVQESVSLPYEHIQDQVQFQQTPSLYHSSTQSKEGSSVDLEYEVPREQTWFQKRVNTLCQDRAVNMLTSPNMTPEELHPAISIHLDSLSVNELLQAMIETISSPKESSTPSIILQHPTMFRTIEGGDALLLSRQPDSAPQRLIHGRTRTKLGTNQSDFQGEWLEPIDVQEYLESQGIFLGDCEPGQILRTTLPMSTIDGVWAQDSDAIFTEEMQRSKLLPFTWPVDIGAQFTPPQVADQVTFPFPISARQNDAPNSSLFARSYAPPSVLEVPKDQIITAQHNVLDNRQQQDYAESAVNIVLNLDIMIKYLVEAACCIGPGPGIRLQAVKHALRISLVVL